MNEILFPVLYDNGEKEWACLEQVLGFRLRPFKALASAVFLIYVYGNNWDLWLTIDFLLL